MPGCSNVRKPNCLERQDCQWIVGKGCSKVDNKPAPSPSPAEPIAKQPSPISPTSQVELVTVTEVKAIGKQVWPVLMIGTDAIVLMNTHVHKILKSAFKKIRKDVVSKNEVRYLNFVGPETGELAIYGLRDAKQFLKNPAMARIKRTFSKRLTSAGFKNSSKQVISFDNDGVMFLIGYVELFVAKILEVAGGIAVANKKKAIKAEHVKQAMTEDKDLNEAVRPSKDWAVYVVNGQNVL